MPNSTPDESMEEIAKRTVKRLEEEARLRDEWLADNEISDSEREAVFSDWKRKLAILEPLVRDFSITMLALDNAVNNIRDELQWGYGIKGSADNTINVTRILKIEHDVEVCKALNPDIDDDIYREALIAQRFAIAQPKTAPNRELRRASAADRPQAGGVSQPTRGVPKGSQPPRRK